MVEPSWAAPPPSHWVSVDTEDGEEGKEREEAGEGWRRTGPSQLPPPPSLSLPSPLFRPLPHLFPWGIITDSRPIAPPVHTVYPTSLHNLSLLIPELGLSDDRRLNLSWPLPPSRCRHPVMLGRRWITKSSSLHLYHQSCSQSPKALFNCCIVYTFHGGLPLQSSRFFFPALCCQVNCRVTLFRRLSPTSSVVNSVQHSCTLLLSCPCASCALLAFHRQLVC